MSHSSDDERPIGPVNSYGATSANVEVPIELRRLPPDSNANTAYSSDDEVSFRPVVSKRVTIVVDEAESCSLLPNPDADDDGFSIDDVGAPTTQIATYPQTRSQTIYNNRGTSAYNRYDDVPSPAKLTALEQLTSNWRPKNFGLANIGNSCYMNTALQCLLSTTEFTHFFLRGFYKKEINMDNPLGKQGKIAEAFKLLTDEMHSHSETWLPRRNQWGYAVHSFEPLHFKRAICDLNAGMFRGFEQQDSQELLSSVLDGIHEDLNRVKKKPYVENVVGDGTNDVAVAAEAWDRYKMRNDSFVVDTFQGQMRSRVTCNECHNMSVSFDPSRDVSVAFKRVVPPSSCRVIVKFVSPQMQRPLDQVLFSDLPEGFHYDCDVKVFTEPSDTFGSLVKRFEDKSPGLRFIAMSFLSLYNKVSCYDALVPASQKLPMEKSYEDYVIVEMPAAVADAWIQADRLASHVASSSTPASTAKNPVTPKLQPSHKASNFDTSSDSDSDDAPEVNLPDFSLSPEDESGLRSFILLDRLVLGKNRRSALQPVLDKLQAKFRQQQDAAIGINSIPILVMQRSRYKTKNCWGSVIAQGFKTVDVPLYIWVAEGTRLTPRTLFEKVYNSICFSLTSAETQKEFESLVKEKIADQNLICFGTTSNFTLECTEFTEERPLLVHGVNAVVLDWELNADILDMITPIMAPQIAGRVADEPPTTLEAMLQAYVEEEQLNGPNQWRCPHCKKDCDASKQMHLWRSSDILIVHLKRFGVDQYGMRSRLNTFVDVPLGEVDFSPYFAPDSPFRVENNRYRLYAVANHTGGAHGGHYYAYCRPNDGEQWVEFNDGSVHQSVDPVITKAAYILFFRRVSSVSRTLENLRAEDQRCLDGSDWMNELPSEPAESSGAVYICREVKDHATVATAHSDADSLVESGLKDSEDPLELDKMGETHFFQYL